MIEPSSVVNKAKEAFNAVKSYQALWVECGVEGRVRQTYADGDWLDLFDVEEYADEQVCI